MTSDFKFVFKTTFVNGFQQTWSDHTMNFDGGVDYVRSQIIIKLSCHLLRYLCLLL